MVLQSTNSKVVKRFATLEDDVKAVHNNRYTYNNFIYVNTRTPGSITCQEHGDFQQLITVHLKGHGCPKCRAQKLHLRTKYTKEQFITKAIEVHGDVYDYSDVVYVNDNTPIQISCNIHGKFHKRPGAHTSGRQGCPTCSLERSVAARTLTTDEFVCKASTVHSSYYTYNKTIYGRNSKDKVIITCPKHGDFEQAANSHLQGSGCISCAKGGFDHSKPAIVYYLSINNGEAYKIGVTNLSVKERYTNDDLEKITILDTWVLESGRECYLLEQEILKTYTAFKYTGKNLLRNGNTELFNTDIHNNIKDLINGRS